MNIFKYLRGLWDKNYRSFSVHQLDGHTSFGNNLDYTAKLNLALNNPAFLKVLALQCSMFALGKWFVYKDEQEADDDVLLDFLNEPNPFQISEEFLWEFMFWQMLGVSHMYIDTDDKDRLVKNKMYLLRPYSLVLPEELKTKSDHLVLSTSKLEEIYRTQCSYKYNDGSAIKFDYKKLLTVSDLGSPISRSQHPSRIDALLKVIQNNEATMDSMNINIKYAGKFMVAGKTDPNDVTRLPLSEIEKKDIEDKMLKDSPVEAVKSMIEIKRFVENAGRQNLDGLWLHTYFVIGSMYNIPKDVLEAFNSGTYENQEKARGAHISYALQPTADRLATKLSKHLNLKDSGTKLYLSWEHLPFMQVFAEQKARAEYTKSQTLLNLLKAGVPIDEINEFLDTKFSTNGNEQNQ